MILAIAAFALLGWLAALLSLYLLLLSIAALFYRPRSVFREPATQLLVLIPAHNEEGLIERCVRSLREQRYPRDLQTIVVIADNCTDGTAAAALAAGADRVLERTEPDARGKGHALRWAMDQLLAADDSPQAVVVVDADSVAEPDFLTVLSAEFEAGAEVVQGDYVLGAGGGDAAALRAAAFMLVNRVRQAGRAALGQSALLVGNGMLFSGELLKQRPWGAFTSAEDLEFTLDLQLGGVKVAFAGNARLSSETAPNADAAATQQRRWEGGRLYLLRARGPGLIREAVLRRRLALIPLAIELAMPPLGLLAAATVTGGAGALALAAVDGDGWGVVPWAIAGAAVPAYVLIGLRAGQAPRSSYRALAAAPRFVLRKPLEMRGVLSFRPDSWVRTERAGERAGGDD